jgi:sn-glycerol 3-phosphate transport system permease protein
MTSAELVQARPIDRPVVGSRRRRRSLLPYLLLAPALTFLAAFTYWPLLQAMLSSLSTRRRVNDAGGFAGLDNYQRLLTDTDFHSAALNNLVYAAGTVVPSVVIALAFALALRESTRLNAVFRAAFFFPTLVPMVAASALFIFILMPDIGLLDHYLNKLAPHAVNWLGDPRYALASLMALTVWKNAGYYMLFFLAGLQGISKDAEEAATIEGATVAQRLWYVTLPLLGPTTAFVVVIALINAITQVDHVIVMTQGGPNNATSLLLYYIYQQAHEYYDLGKATAATVVSLAVLLAISLTSLRTMERGVHYEK